MRSATASTTSPSVVQTINVELGDRSYPIIVGRNLLDELGPRLATLVSGHQTAVVTNPTVGKLYLDRVRRSLEDSGFSTTTVEIPDGEEYKNLGSLSSIYDRLLAQHIERSTPILALGGGVIGDLAGFAAATLLRGLPLIQIPTTLLAQVDSSVGGKTGINHATGKNLIGAFYQPRMVVADVDTLATLPDKEFVAGLAEVIKYGAIMDSDLFALLENEVDRILARDSGLLQSVVRRCCALKAMVVQRDERESDYRSILNFGHTVAHAVESATDYRGYLHGEAVAMGMAFAARLSHSRGYCKRETMQRVVALLERSGLPTDVPPDLRGARLLHGIASDKKLSGGKVKFICLEDIGRARFESMTGHEIARSGGE